jgi:hypothetical protein
MAKSSARGASSRKTPKRPETLPETSSWRDIHAALIGAHGPRTSPFYEVAGNAPLMWSEMALPSDRAALLTKLQNVAQNRENLGNSAENWVADLTDFCESIAERVDRWRSLEAIAWVHASPALAHLVEAEDWTQLMSTLSQLVFDLLDESPGDDLVIEQRLVEMGISLDILFPTAPDLAVFSDDLRKRASFAITDITDGEGIPRSAVVRDLRDLVATWIRLALLADSTGGVVFDDDAQMQLEWLVRQSAVLSRRGGDPLFAESYNSGQSRDFFAAALGWENDDDDARYAGALLGIGQSAVCGKKKRAVLADEMNLDFDSPTLYSEWASLAVMRGDWSEKSPVVGVTFDDRKLMIDAGNKNGSIFCGDTTPFIQIDGRLAEISSDITEVCWHSDDDCDYLEVEMRLSGNWRIQRQYLFSRHDRFLWVADVLLGTEVAKIQYSCPWPLATRCEAIPEKETRDLRIQVGGKTHASVIPAAAAEWRIAKSPCELKVVDGGLRLDFEVEARAAYIPLFFELGKKHASRDRTWRRLTVAEQLEIMTPDVAAGFRVQSGKRQWMFYRSLGPRGNRSLMGQNTVAEFLAGRFNDDGLLDELVEVE